MSQILPTTGKKWTKIIIKKRTLGGVQSFCFCHYICKIWAFVFVHYICKICGVVATHASRILNSIVIVRCSCNWNIRVQLKISNTSAHVYLVYLPLQVKHCKVREWLNIRLIMSGDIMAQIYQPSYFNCAVYPVLIQSKIHWHELVKK